MKERSVGMADRLYFTFVNEKNARVPFLSSSFTELNNKRLAGGGTQAYLCRIF